MTIHARWFDRFGVDRSRIADETDNERFAIAKTSNCLSLSGTSTGQVTFGQRVTMGTINALTVLLWYKSTYTGAGIRGIIGEFRSSTGDRAWVLTNVSGRLRVIMSDDGSAGASNHKDYTTTAVISDGNWHYISVVFDGANLIISIDEQEAAVTKTNDGPITSLFDTPASFLIGRWDAHTAYWPGQLAGVYIIQQAYTASQRTRSAQPISGVVGAYPLAEGGGSTRYDVSGRGINGTNLAGATNTTQDVFHYNLRVGCTDSSGTKIPALLNGSADAAGNPIGSPGGAWLNDGCETKLDLSASGWDPTTIEGLESLVLPNNYGFGDPLPTGMYKDEETGKESNIRVAVPLQLEQFDQFNANSHKDYEALMPLGVLTLGQYRGASAANGTGIRNGRTDQGIDVTFHGSGTDTFSTASRLTLRPQAKALWVWGAGAEMWYESAPHEQPDIGKGEWSGGKHHHGDIVTAGDWTQRALRTTEDNPEPIGDGNQFWLSGLGDTPAWSNQQQTVKQMALVQRVRVVNGLFNLSRRLWVAQSAATVKYELWLVSDPLGTPAFSNLLPSFVPNLGDVGTWFQVPSGRTVESPGSVFDVVLFITSEDSPTTWSAEWDYKTKNGSPAATDGEIWHNSAGGSRTMAVSRDDKNGTNQQTNLDNLNPGDLIAAGGQTWQIAQRVSESWGATLTVDPGTRINENTYLFTFTQYGAQAIDYTQILGHYTPQPRPGIFVGGGLSTTGYNPQTVVIDDTCYGVDCQLENAILSPDWEYRAYSG